jgi:multiple sugar transport system substrate-binding protein
VLVDSPRFVRAFELAKKVREQKLDGKIGAWSNEWSEGFKRGTIATQLSGAWLAGHLNNWLAPNTKGLWRVSQLPEKAYGSWGGSFYTIPKATKNKALAWEFIQMMTLSPEMQLSAFKSQDAFPALVDVHKDAFFDQPIEFLGGQKARLLWRDAANKITAVDVHKLDPIAEEIVNTEMDKVLDQGKDVKTALADAKALLERRVARAQN